jgi:hypothetical protein
MTDVVVQPLHAAQRTRIKCGEYIRHLAMFDSLVAVLAGHAITIYDQQDGKDAAWRVHARIPNAPPCEVLAITSQHVILGQQRRLCCYDFQGSRCASRPCHAWPVTICNPEAWL